MLKKIIVLFITMMMTASLCISCGTEKVKLTWAFFDLGVDMTAFQESLNKELKNQKIPYEIEFVNVQVEFENDYRDYVYSYIEEIEKNNYDIVSCPGVINSYDMYVTMANEGLLTGWNEILQNSEEGKKLKKSYPEIVWDSLTYKDEIYGVLTPYTDYNFYAVFNMEYAEKYGINVSNLTFLDMGPLLQEVAEGESEKDPSFVVSIGWPYFLRGKYEHSLCELICIIDDNSQSRAENILYQQDFLEQMKLLNEWGSKGLVADGMSDYWNSVERGNFFVSGVYSYSEEAAENYYRNTMNIPDNIELQAVEFSEFNKKFYSTGVKVGVNPNCEYKEEAQKVIAAIYSNTDLSNALVHGTEGKSYTYKNGVAVPLAEYQCSQLTRKMNFGNPFLTIPDTMDSSSKKEELWNLVNKMDYSIQIGHMLDLTGEAEKISRINTYVMEGYNESLHGNSVQWEEDLENMRMTVEKTGINTVIDEINKQLEPVR